jgi:8-oxo-dGTP diphosphatase
VIRSIIRGEIEGIQPYDAVENSHRRDALAWVDSGLDLFRREKPATPPKHLVSYVVVTDGRRVLLVDHKDAQLWLPPGGHVEPGENPRVTVQRELKEELGLTASQPVSPPLFLTCTETVGHSAGHIDVSMWYVVYAEAEEALAFDGVEFESVGWFAFADVPHHRSDPHLARFLRKFSA